MTNYKAHVKYGHVYGDTLATPTGRIIWTYLVSPKDAPDPKPGEQRGAPKYEATLLLDKKEASLTPFVSVIDKMYDEMLAVFNKKRLSQQGAPLGKGPLFSDGDGEWVDPKKYPFYKGMWLLRATNTQKPGVWDVSKAALDPAAVKPGMLGKFVVTPMATSHGLRFKLTDVQLLKDDGVSYGGFTRDTSSFLDAVGPAETTEAPETEEAATEAPPEPPPAGALEGKKTLSPAEQAAARRAAAQSQTQNQRRASLDKL